MGHSYLWHAVQHTSKLPLNSFPAQRMQTLEKKNKAICTWHTEKPGCSATAAAEPRVCSSSRTLLLSACANAQQQGDKSLSFVAQWFGSSLRICIYDCRKLRKNPSTPIEIETFVLLILVLNKQQRYSAPVVRSGRVCHVQREDGISLKPHLWAEHNQVSVSSAVKTGFRHACASGYVSG